jgi:hypothetical protein
VTPFVFPLFRRPHEGTVWFSRLGSPVETVLQALDFRFVTPPADKAQKKFKAEASLLHARA